ncbi:MAG: sulfurtransferase TusA family protein [Bacillota bacterium]
MATSHFLDLVGEICPVPLILTQRKVAEMDSGDSLILETDYPRAVRNIMDWCRNNTHLYRVEERGKGVWRIILTKK